MLVGTVLAIFHPVAGVWVSIWVGAGILIALFAWRAGAWQSRDTREIRENLGKLVSVTEASPSNIIAATAAKILELEHKTATLPKLEADLKAANETIRQHEETNWYGISHEMKRELTQALGAFRGRSVWVQHTGQQDCYEMAIDLAEAFREAGWQVAPIGRQATASATRGLEVLGRDKAFVKHISMLLLPITRRHASHSGELFHGPDIAVRIGPRKMRDSEWL